MLDSICDVLKKSYDLGYITSRDGNASYRRKDEPYIYVTPSGTRKYHLNGEMLIKLKIKNPSRDTLPSLQDLDLENELERVDDEVQRRIIGLVPSGELPLHFMMQYHVPHNRVVLHLHPTYTVAALYKNVDLQKLSDDFIELRRYTRVAPSIGPVDAISKELAKRVIDALGLDPITGETKYDIVALDRHGIVAVGPDVWTCYEHVERLEHICKISQV